MLDADVVTRLRRVVGKLARELNASATDEGLTPTQASVLGLTAARGPLTLAELVDLERINPTMLSRVIGRLDEVGYIRRVPDPDDMRTVSIEITPDGKAAHAHIRSKRTEIVARSAAELEERQFDDIVAALPALEALAAGLEGRRSTA